MTRTQYARYAPQACQAITAKGDACTRLGREVAIAVSHAGEPHHIRLCRTHEHQIDRVIRTGQPFPVMMVDGTIAEVEPPTEARRS